MLIVERDSLVQGYWWPYGEKFMFVLYLVAWLNTFVLALFVTTLPVDAFEGLLCLFPIINGLHVAGEIVLCKGLVNYILSEDREDRFMSRIIALFTVCASWTGLFLMFIQVET